ncbi:MAG TPA: LysE family transporter [Stellaceae bacterium]|nr:LysE family transporter [Stellaceae bacterium]
MDLVFFAKGIAAGLLIGVPIGPVGILCLRRTIFDGPLAGFVSGLGAASGDALFGAVAGFGLTAISNWLLQYEDWLRFTAACFLLYIGGGALRRGAQAHAAEHRESEGLLRNYLATLALTVANPVTIFAFFGIFAGLGAAEDQADFGRAATLVFGVWVGSLLWWLLLSLGAGVFRGSLNPRILGWINRGSGAVLLLSGAGLLAMLAFSHRV